MANSIDVDRFEFIALLTDEEKVLFRALDEGTATRLYMAGKRGGVEAVRAQLYPLSRGEAPPPLPPTADELALPASDPSSPQFASWCASQLPRPPQCDPTTLPPSDPRNPKFAAWCAEQSPRPLECPTPGASPIVAGAEYPLTDPRNPGFAAHCSTLPTPAGCPAPGGITTTPPGSTPPATVAKSEGIIDRIVREKPWPLFLAAGLAIGFVAAKTFGGDSNKDKSDDD